MWFIIYFLYKHNFGRVYMKLSLKFLISKKIGVTHLLKSLKCLMLQNIYTHMEI